MAMTTFIKQTFTISGGYEITLTEKGAEIVDSEDSPGGTCPQCGDFVTLSEPTIVLLEPTTPTEARELSVALRFAQRRIETIWREMRAKEEADRSAREH
jgi:hypothetical protein